MTRLSEGHLTDLEQRGYSMNRAGYARAVAVKQAELAELTRGYRRATALEDMLQEWVTDTRKSNLCDFCYGGGGGVGAPCTEDCLAKRTEALLAEGDE